METETIERDRTTRGFITANTPAPVVQFIQFMGRLTISLLLCVTAGVIAGCATTMETTAVDEEEEEVEVAREEPVKEEVMKPAPKKAKPRKAPRRVAKAPSKPKKEPVAVAAPSATTAVASTNDPIERPGSGRTWLFVLVPLAVATAGFQFARRKRHNGKAPSNLRNSGDSPGPSPPDTGPPRGT